MKTTFKIEKYGPCSEGLDYYLSQDSVIEAWENCQRGDWMLWIASKIGVDLAIMTKAKALCANTARHLMKDERSTNAIDVALKFSDGKATIKELDAAAAAADAAYAAAAATADAADAAREKNRIKTAEICRKVLTGEVFNIVNGLAIVINTLKP